MSEKPTTTLERIAELLQRHEVKFIVIGGQAEYIFSSPRVTFDVEPLGDYSRLDRSATNYQVGNLVLRVINLDDLITIKQHIGRAKDRESLHQLMAIKKIRGETGLE